MLEIGTLGGLSIRLDGQFVEGIGLRKAEALLVYLIAEGGEQKRESLANMFWSESSQEQSARSLRVALSILRKKFADYLDISRESVTVRQNTTIALDINDLETKCAFGQMDEALALYRGEFLQGFHVQDSPDFEDWVRFKQTHLLINLTEGLHSAISEAIEIGDYSKGCSLANRLLFLDPLNELAYRRSMLLYALQGQRSNALAQYEKYRSQLMEDLGSEPSREMSDLYEKVLHGEDLTPFLRDIAPFHLPAPQTSFIGRELELRHINALIHDPACRLLTLMGPGGSGKTRLALRIARAVLRLFPDGIWFIPFEGCFTEDHIITTISYGLQFEGDSITSTQMDLKNQLLNYLRKRSILLVMDGFEHLADHAEIFSDILESAPRVKLLVTSRQRLGLEAEWTYSIQGLSTSNNAEQTGSEDSDATRLFIERARQVKLDFTPSSQDRQNIAHICQIVEGLPLGIELAASWLSSLSLTEIAAEIDKTVDFLSRPMGNASEKHHSLYGVFERSWSRLTVDQREIYAKLSVFPAAFDRLAAEEITGANVQQLSQFVDMSLLKRDVSGYYSLHNLLKQFAKDKLHQKKMDVDHIHEKFSCYYANFLTNQKALLMSAAMVNARQVIRQEFDNIRAAIYWATIHWDVQIIRPLYHALIIYYTVHNWQEGLDTFRDLSHQRMEFLIVRGVPDPAIDHIFLIASIHYAFVLSNIGQIEESEQIARDCLEPLRKFGFKEELSECMQILGLDASFKGDYESAKTYLEKAVLVGHECDFEIWPIFLLWLGHTQFLLGEYEQGLLSIGKVYEVYDRMGSQWGKAFALSKIGMAYDGLKKHHKAIGYHQESLEIFEKIGNQAGIGYALSRMSLSAWFLGDYVQAAQLGLRGLEAFNDLGHSWGIGVSWCRVGFSYLGLGDTDTARRYFKDALLQSTRNQMMPLRLYALLGLACVQTQWGNWAAAKRLVRYIQEHPETPQSYIDQAAFWLSKLE
ncbi:MAG: BTAD domain-containing putative transcriptional regulator, partial [Anaerolineales bacterium]